MPKYRVKVPLTIVATKYFTAEGDTPEDAYESVLDEAYELPTETWLDTAEHILEDIPETDQVNLKEVVEELHE